MPRTPRIVVPNLPHHIMQRGNRRERVFFDDSDYLLYLDILRKQCARYGLSVQGFCLMPNHIHIIATPERVDSLARMMGQCQHLYAIRVNKRLNRVGHLWHSRFHSCPLDGAHLLNALIYVDRNPVRAGLVRNAWEWEWSSARDHLEGKNISGLIDMSWRRRFAMSSGWEEVIRKDLGDEAIEELRKFTHSGKPLGSEKFVDAISVKLGYSVEFRRSGRPTSKLDSKGINKN